MKTRRRKVIWLGIALLIGLAAWLVFRNREPVYDGKRLSEWTEDLRLIGPVGATSEISDAIQRTDASTAIRAIGDKAIPFLLDDIQTKPYPWESMPAGLTGWLPKSIALPTADIRWERGVAGICALGELAEPAIPELEVLVQSGSGVTPRVAQYAIAYIGTERAVTSLAHGLTNADSAMLFQTLNCLAQMGEKALPAVPALLTNLESGSAQIRRAVVLALSQIRPEPHQVLPGLVKLLGDPDITVQRASIDFLAEFDSRAIGATPALERFVLETRNPSLRRSAQAALIRINCEMRDGGILRGPKNRKVVALVFTGHEYADGAEVILGELARHRARASCFLTGDFLRNTNFVPIAIRAAKEGHLIGPHSDKHLLYCSWETDRRTLISAKEFTDDLMENQVAIRRVLSPEESATTSPEQTLFRLRYGLSGGSGITSIDQVRYLLPPYEHYNRQIVEWTKSHDLTLINFTLGTRSNADYTGEADTNFVSSQAIFESILKREREDPHGLNGFILLLHLGSGPRRADKFHTRFGELLDVLAAKGYQFVRVDELLEPPKEEVK